MQTNQQHEFHSDAWWMRVLDGALTHNEDKAWQSHLTQCPACREEWQALQDIDCLLRVAPPVPPLPNAFTVQTVDLILHKQQRRRVWGYIAGALILVLVALLVLSYTAPAFATLTRTINAVIAGRQLLFASLIHTIVGLIVSWKALLPFIVGFVILDFLLLMPNSVLAAVVLWQTRQRRRVGAFA